VTTAVRTSPTHDNSSCIKWHGCHLPDCRERYNARRRAIRAGLIQPRALIDAEPVRQHILALVDAGLAPTRIARLAGMSHTNITDFLHGSPGQGRGRKRQTSPEIAEKILAVQPITTTGTLRRIRALVAIGWPVRQIAARANVSARWILDLHEGVVVNFVTSLKIAEAYAELRKLDPEEHGVWAGHAKRARERAKANKWPDPKYWDQHLDDLDDPHFEPLYGVTRREIVAQDANFIMRTTGVNKTEAAARMGIHKTYLEHAFREHPEYAVEAAA
jgi:DNA-binding protein Fis